MNKMRTWLRGKRGQGIIEYALILVLITIVGITVMKGLGTSVSQRFSTVNSTLQ